MNWWQKWIKYGYRCAERGLPIEQALDGQTDGTIAKLIRKGYSKWARHEKRVARMRGIRNPQPQSRRVNIRKVLLDPQSRADLIAGGVNFLCALEGHDHSKSS